MPSLSASLAPVFETCLCSSRRQKWVKPCFFPATTRTSVQALGIKRVPLDLQPTILPGVGVTWREECLSLITAVLKVPSGSS